MAIHESLKVEMVKKLVFEEFCASVDDWVGGISKARLAGDSDYREAIGRLAKDIGRVEKVVADGTEITDEFYVALYDAAVERYGDLYEEE